MQYKINIFTQYNIYIRFKKKGKIMNKTLTTEAELINRYIKALLTENDLNLIRLIFSKNPTQNQLDEFLKTYDIEVADGYKALMLSYFMKMHPELNFTMYEAPRLKGLFNYFRFQNLKLTSSFVKIAKILNENNIPFLILKGYAMKYFRPDLPRPMGDIDIIVHEKDYIKCIDICKKLGYRCCFFIHSVDLHEPDSEEGLLDIHRYIDMGSNSERKYTKELFKRAKTIVYNGIEMLIPSYEDLFFLILVNISKNLYERTSKASNIYALFDSAYLLSRENFNWEIVLGNIKLTHTATKAAFVVKFINSIVPNLIPEAFLNQKLLKKNSHNYFTLMKFNDFFLVLQRLSRGIKLSSAFNNFKNFMHYLEVKPLYILCKNSRKSPFMASLILKARGSI